MLAFAIQFAASLVAVAAMVGIAFWARVPRPTPPLTEEAARALLAEEFPGEGLQSLWLAGDGAGAIARAGAKALVLFRVGDGYTARSLAWRDAHGAAVRDGKLSLRFDDIGAPRARLALANWPPAEAAA